MPQAARLQDPIGHSPTMNWLLRGVVIGAAIGLSAVAIAGTGGLAAVAVVGGLVAGGAGVGEVLSTLSGVEKEVTGKITGPCSPNVFTNGKAAARAMVDFTTCDKHSGTLPIATGSATVFINNMPAARVSDKISCSAVITVGSSNVFIGGGTRETNPITPENLVPPVVHGVMLVAGLGAGVVLVGPIAAGLGLGAGMLGGWAGAAAGAKMFGQDSDGQKLLGLGGSLIGGIVGTKGGTMLSGALFPTPTTPVAGIMRGGVPGMKAAAANAAEEAQAAAQARVDRRLAQDAAREPEFVPDKKDGKFTDVRKMLKDYVGEETGGKFEGSKVKYLDEVERLDYQLTVKDGKLYDAKGKLFDTAGSKTLASGEGKAIFVMDESGVIYASKVHGMGVFHHSSFLGGKPVAAAGEVVVQNGVLTGVNRKSGHYLPTHKQLRQFVYQLREDGVDMQGVNIGAF